MEYDYKSKEELIAELNQIDQAEEFNGWKNRETWAFNLWMSNDQGTCEMVEEMAKEAYAEAVVTEDKYLTTEELARFNMSEKLKDYLEMLQEEIAPESKEVRMMLDDIGSSWRIDYREVAEHHIDDLIRENEAEQEL